MNTQVQKFEKVWNDFNDPNKAVVNSNEILGNNGYSITLTVFVHGKINKELNKLINKLKKLSPEHRYSTSDELHITIKFIKYLPSKSDDLILQKYVQKVKAIIESFPHFKLEINGLNHFPNVIFAQVFSSDNQIFKLHRKLCSVLPSSFPIYENENYTPHIAIVPQFKSNPSKLFDEIKRYRNHSFGELNINKIELTKWKFPPCGKHEEIYTFELAKK